MTKAPTFPVRFELPASGTRTSATARDVSLGGMFVVTSSPASEGALLVVEIDLEGVKVSVDARVLRRDADGMQVVFIDLPDDVAAILSAAVTPTSARTILGVGSTNIKATTPGIAVPPAPVDVPSVKATTPGIAAPAEAKKAAAKITKPTSKSKSKDDEKWERKEVGDADDRAKRASSTPPPPPPKSGSGGLWFFLLLLIGAGAAAYVYREPLKRQIDDAMGPAPTATPAAPAPSVTASMTPSAVPSATPIEEAGVAATTDAGSFDASATDASATDASAADAGASDASATDGGRDAGAKDAGAHRDAGHK